MRSFILFLLYICTSYASFSEKLQLAVQKPWLASRLIVREEILEYTNKNSNDQYTSIIEYELWRNRLECVAQTKSGSNEYFLLNWVTGEIFPQMWPTAFAHTPSFNQRKYYCGKRVIDAKSALQLDNFRAYVQIGEMLFLIDKRGVLFQSERNWHQSQWHIPEQCGAFELGNEVQTRFVNCAILYEERAEVGASLFLETVDERILEMKILIKQKPSANFPWEGLDDFYPRVFRTKEQFEEEIRTGTCDAVPQDFVKRLPAQSSRYKIPNFVMKFGLQYSKNSFITSIMLSITALGLFLLLPKNRILTSILLLALVGKLVFEVYLGTILKIILRQKNN